MRRLCAMLAVSALVACGGGAREDGGGTAADGTPHLLLFNVNEIEPHP